MKTDLDDPSVKPDTPPLEFPAAGKHLAFHLKKILVPVDFSKCSAKALQYAVPFAKQFGGEILLLHVIPPAVVLPSSGVESPPGMIQESTAEAREDLEEFRRGVGEDIPVRCVTRSGSPHIEIVDAAKQLEVDLIIISTHGYTGLSHFLLGATAEKVIRRASCPVLIVREHEHEFITVEDGSP